MLGTVLSVVFVAPTLLGFLAIGRSKENAPRAMMLAGAGFLTTGLLWAGLLLTITPDEIPWGASKMLVASPLFIVTGLAFLLVGFGRSRNPS